MVQEATLVVIKPETIRRGLVGQVISRLEELQLDIIGVKVVHVTRELAEAHYQALRDKPFFAELLEHIQGKLHHVSFVLAFVLAGPNAVERVRHVTGATHPEKADPRSIRGALGRMTTSGLMENILHASSTLEEAKREIPLWFKPEELLRHAASRTSDVPSKARG